MNTRLAKLLGILKSSEFKTAEERSDFEKMVSTLDPSEVNGCDSKGETLLATAVGKKGSHGIVNSLLAAKADPDTASRGIPVVSTAAKQGDVKLVDSLLKAGANPIKSDIWIYENGDQYDSKLMPVDHALRGGHLECLLLLIPLTIEKMKAEKKHGHSDPGRNRRAVLRELEPVIKQRQLAMTHAGEGKVSEHDRKALSSCFIKRTRDGHAYHFPPASHALAKTLDIQKCKAMSDFVDFNALDGMNLNPAEALLADKSFWNTPGFLDMVYWLFAKIPAQYKRNEWHYLAATNHPDLIAHFMESWGNDKVRLKRELESEDAFGATPLDYTTDDAREEFLSACPEIKREVPEFTDSYSVIILKGDRYYSKSPKPFAEGSFGEVFDLVPKNPKDLPLVMKVLKRSSNIRQETEMNKINGFAVTDGSRKIVMEKKKGERLSDWITEKYSSLSANDLIEIAKNIVKKLTHLHDNYIIHLDLQPWNIFIEENKSAGDTKSPGDAKSTHEKWHIEILDFGLAAWKDRLTGQSFDSIIRRTDRPPECKIPTPAVFSMNVFMLAGVFISLFVREEEISDVLNGPDIVPASPYFDRQRSLSGYQSEENFVKGDPRTHLSYKLKTASPDERKKLLKDLFSSSRVKLRDNDRVVDMLHQMMDSVPENRPALAEIQVHLDEIANGLSLSTPAPGRRY